jgi:hypothetical protein
VTFLDVKLCAETSDLGTGAKVVLTSGACLIASLGWFRAFRRQEEASCAGFDLVVVSQLARLLGEVLAERLGDFMGSY